MEVMLTSAPAPPAAATQYRYEETEPQEEMELWRERITTLKEKQNYEDKVTCVSFWIQWIDRWIET